ncbi:MAG: hypothetical protein WBG42_09415 [Cryomorphaceae bacterium]
MNNQYLSEFQLDQVRAVLKKYGIESDDLLDELTDHYSGLLEEQIEKGASFDEAFQTFVSENSWFKLRKLQHAHWKYADASIKRYVLGLLRELWLTPKVVITVGLIAGLIALLRLPVEETQWFFNVVHSSLIVLVLYILVSSYAYLRKYKSHDLRATAAMSGSMFYVVFMSFWTTNEALFYPLFPGENAFVLHVIYYMVLGHLTYIYWNLFMRAKTQTSKREVLG